MNPAWPILALDDSAEGMIVQRAGYPGRMSDTHFRAMGRKRFRGVIAAHCVLLTWSLPYLHPHRCG